HSQRSLKRPPARCFHRRVKRAARAHGRVCPAHRSSRDASALGFWLPAVTPHPLEPRRSARRSKNFSREETPVRRTHLPRHRILPLWMEHRERFVFLDQTRLLRSQTGYRRTPPGTFSRGPSLRDSRCEVTKHRLRRLQRGEFIQRATWFRQSYQ